MTVPNCLDEGGDPGVIWKMCELCIKQGRKSQTLELDIEGGGVGKEFSCPLEITISASLPESRHHFERNARVKGNEKKINSNEKIRGTSDRSCDVTISIPG